MAEISLAGDRQTRHTGDQHGLHGGLAQARWIAKMAQKVDAAGVCNRGVGKHIEIGDLARLILDRMNFAKPILVSEDRLRPEGSEVLDLVAETTSR